MMDFNFPTPKVQMNQTFSRKCRYCTPEWAHWPDAEQFEHCPRCLEPTERSLKPAMPLAEAMKYKREYEFGWWLYETGGL